MILYFWNSEFIQLSQPAINGFNHEEKGEKHDRSFCLTNIRHYYRLMFT